MMLLREGLRAVSHFAQNNLSRFFFGTPFEEIYRGERIFEVKNLQFFTSKTRSPLEKNIPHAFRAKRETVRNILFKATQNKYSHLVLFLN
jgi:hypothetical protein